MPHDDDIIIRRLFASAVLIVCVVIAYHAPQQQQHLTAWFPPQPERIQRRKGLTDLHLDFEQRIIQLKLYTFWFNFFLDSPMASFIEAVNQKNSV